MRNLTRGCRSRLDFWMRIMSSMYIDNTIHSGSTIFEGYFIPCLFYDATAPCIHRATNPTKKFLIIDGPITNSIKRTSQCFHSSFAQNNPKFANSLFKRPVFKSAVGLIALLRHRVKNTIQTTYTPFSDTSIEHLSTEF